MIIAVTATIFAGLLISALLLVLILSWRQHREEARRYELERLNTRIRRLETLAYGIPSAYIHQEVHLLIVQIACDLLHRAKALDPVDNYPALLKEWRQLEKQIKEGAAASAEGNEPENKEIRENLKALYKFIRKQIELGQLNRSFGQQQLIQTRFFLIKNLADTHMSAAHQAEQNQNYRSAIHHIHNAIDTLMKTENSPETEELLADYRRQVKILNKKAENRLIKEGAAAPSSNTLSAQLEKMTDNEEEWKIKQDYDS